MKVISAKCPDCGSPIALASDGRPSKCIACASECFLTDDQLVKVIIQRDPNETQNFLLLAKEAYKSGNTSESYRYCGQVLEREPKNAEAWMLKGLCAAWEGTLANSRLPEMVSGFVNCHQNDGISLISEFGQSQAILITKARTNAWREHKEKYMLRDENVRVEWQQALVEVVGVLEQIFALHNSEAISATIIDIASNAAIDIYIREYMTNIKNKHEAWLRSNSTVHSNSSTPTANIQNTRTIHNNNTVSPKTSRFSKIVVIFCSVFILLIIIGLFGSSSTSSQSTSQSLSEEEPSAQRVKSKEEINVLTKKAADFIANRNLNRWKSEGTRLGLSGSDLDQFVQKKIDYYVAHPISVEVKIEQDKNGKIVDVKEILPLDANGNPFDPREQ